MAHPVSSWSWLNRKSTSDEIVFIVGYAMGARMTKERVHADRASQYCSQAYQDLIRKSGMRASMYRKGNCCDNAPTDSFWDTLKQEMVHHSRFRTWLEAQAAIQERMEIFDNRTRRQTSLGGIAPARWAHNDYATRKSASVAPSTIDSRGHFSVTNAQRRMLCTVCLTFSSFVFGMDSFLVVAPELRLDGSPEVGVKLGPDTEGDALAKFEVDRILLNTTHHRWNRGLGATTYHPSAFY